LPIIIRHYRLFIGQITAAAATTTTTTTTTAAAATTATTNLLFDDLLPLSSAWPVTALPDHFWK